KSRAIEKNAPLFAVRILLACRLPGLRHTHLDARFDILQSFDHDSITRRKTFLDTPSVSDRPANDNGPLLNDAVLPHNHRHCGTRRLPDYSLLRREARFRPNTGAEYRPDVHAGQQTMVRVRGDNPNAELARRRIDG